MRPILVLAALSVALYAALPAMPARGLIVFHLLLTAAMLGCWRLARGAGAPVLRAALVAAVLFRVAIVWAPPTLSNDVYRYVWDGRVQVAGHHPYKYAPAHPDRRELRDAAIYPRISHPELPTGHPPLAELLFAVLAAAHLGVTGFKLAMVLADVGVIAALALLLRALGRPREDVLLYAWNPLAVIEIAWSGHLEPAGVALLLIAIVAITKGRAGGAAAALAAAIQTRLLPILLVPGFLRRFRLREVLVLLGVLALLAAPYALRGPAYGAGVLEPLHRGEHGAVVFPVVSGVVERLDLGPGLAHLLDVLKVHAPAVRPQELARITVGLLALGWAFVQSFRPRVGAAHEARLALGGALLLAPALYPWDLLWVLPLAAAARAGGWLLAAALIPLQYLSGAAEVPWAIRLVILVPAVAWMAVDSWRRRALD